MTIYQWAVIGAGPAGIASVGNLLDQGVSAKDILWLDPKFKVGDFGTIWRYVPSNTKVDLFLNFLSACKSFEYEKAPGFELNNLPKNKNCELRFMADPLQWVSDHLTQKVSPHIAHAKELELTNRVWRITTDKETLKAANVVLATGAKPRTLVHEGDMEEIPLSTAMNKAKLKDALKPDSAIAVFGSSHSAVLVLRFLIELGAHKIINFYRSALLYAVYMQDYILFDDSGLKGTTGEWAREFLNGILPQNLIRVYSNNENKARYLPECKQVIYAVGFERTHPQVVGLPELNYIEQTGIIAPGLFGFGIAFPESRMNPIGRVEYRVGLWKFMDYIQRVLPIWLKYST